MSISDNPNIEDNVDNKKSKKKKDKGISIHPYLADVMSNTPEEFHASLIQLDELVKHEILKAKSLIKDGDVEGLYVPLFNRLLPNLSLKMNDGNRVGPIYDFQLNNPMEKLSFSDEEKQYRRNRKKVNQLNYSSLRTLLDKVEESTKGDIEIHEFNIRKHVESNPDRDKPVKLSTFAYTALIELNKLSSPDYKENYTNFIEEFYSKFLEDVTKFTGDVYDLSAFEEFLSSEFAETASDLGDLFNKICEKINQPRKKKPTAKQLLTFTPEKETDEFQELVKIRDIDYARLENRLHYLHMLNGK